MVQVIVLLVLFHVLDVVPSQAGNRPAIVKPQRIGLSAQMVPPVQFKRALLNAIRKQFPVSAMELDIDILVPKSPVKVPAGIVDIQVPPDTVNGRTGRRAYRMGLSVDRKFRRMVNVVAKIDARMPVIVPVRVIKMDEAINARDVMTVDYSIPTLIQNYFKEATTVVGKIATRVLLPNRPIQDSFVAEPAVIQKGDRVIIEARQGGLLVQTMGIAKEAGAPGHMITVQNQQSKRDVMGRVLRSGLVKVLF